MEDTEKMVLLKLGEELLSDPVGRGYKGKNLDEILDLLNSSYTVDRIVIENCVARVNFIFLGVPMAPNIVSMEMLQAVLKINLLV